MRTKVGGKASRILIVSFFSEAFLDIVRSFLTYERMAGGRWCTK